MQNTIVQETIETGGAGEETAGKTDSGTMIAEAAGGETVSRDPVTAQAQTKKTENGPKIALTYVPARGRDLPLQGYVYTGNGSSYTAPDYRVSLYLQVSEGDSYWVKPTEDKPYFDLFEDGSFNGKFITGGDDINAEVLHVMLIPSSYTPSGSGEAAFLAAKDAALDYIKVTRTDNGNVSLSIPGRYQEPKKVPSKVLPVTSGKIAVDVGFYTDDSSPGSELSVNLIRRQLEMVKPFANVVRFYSSGGEVQKAYKIADSMGFTVVGTAWLSGEEDSDRAEMDALIKNCNDGYVQVACVGSETLIRGDLTPEKLIEDIEYVRRRLDSYAIPVTTADGVDELLENAAVRNACDVVMPNCYPYWGGVDNADAPEAFAQSIACLQAACRGKQVIVSETGWPTAGQTIGSAEAGKKESARYFQAIRDWSRKTDTQVLWFSAADEPWKRADEGEAGAHWGLMTKNFVLKTGYTATTFFNKIASKTVDISKAKVTGIKDKVYVGKPRLQVPVVKFGAKTLKRNVDYKLTYKNNVNVGTATVTVTGIGKDGLGRKYTGSITKKFRIKKGPQQVTVKASADSVAVGKTCQIKVTGAKGKVTFKSSNKEVAEVNTSTGKLRAKKVGKVTVSVNIGSTSNYKAATRNVSVMVVPGATASLTAVNTASGVRLKWEQVPSAIGYRVYRNGDKIKTIKAGSTVTWLDEKAKNGKKYKYKIVAEARTGKSTLHKSCTICYVDRPAISKVKNNAGAKMAIRWGKNDKADGYEIQYSRQSDFSKYEIIPVKGKNNVEYLITGLTKGKTYYVRVRTWKKSDGKKYYSVWSKEKTVKIEK